MANKPSLAAWQVAVAKDGQRALLKQIQITDAALHDALVSAFYGITPVVEGLPSNGVSAQIRQAQYFQARAAIGDSISELWDEDIDAVLEDGLRQATDAAVQADKVMASFLLNAVDRNSQDLARSMWASSINNWRNVQSRIMNDIDLSKSVFNNKALMAGKIDELVNLGIASGKSAREIADSVAQYINPNTPGGVRYAAQRLGRTELNNAYHTTSVQTYIESPFVEAVKWHLSGSHPKPDECNEYADNDDWGLGSGMFPPDRVPAKPHPQCFCFVTPVTPSPDDFIERMKGGVYDDALSDPGLAQAAMCH